VKILFLNQVFHPDVASSGQHAADLATHLAAQGHEVHAIASARAYYNPTTTFPREEMWKGVRISRITTGSLGKRTRWRRAVDFAIFLICLAWRLIRLPSYDVVIALTTPPLIGFFATLFVRFKGGRLVYWVMDLNPDQAIAAGWLKENSIAAGVFRRMLRYTLRNCSRVIVLDRFMRQRTIERGARPDTVAIVPPWSHDVAIHFDQAQRDAFRAEHDLSARFVVMYSGNHSPCHPLRPLLEAARSLASHPDIVFCFIGGGSEQPKVKAFAEEHGLSNIRCMPYQPIEKISSSLASADLHVVVNGAPFVGIIHPCKIYNILALGLPVLYIGPPSGHIPDMIPPEAHSKWFYPAAPEQPDAIAGQILAHRGRPFSRDPEELRVSEQFAAGLLIDRLASDIDALGEAPRAVAPQSAGPMGISWPAWGVAASLVLCYAVVIFRLCVDWYSDPNMSYGFFVPLLTGYVVWQDRDTLRKLTPAPNNFGLVLMLIGAALLCMGPPGLNTFAFATRLALVLSVTGAILFLRGFATCQALVYPLLLMFLMIPLPGFVIERVTFPLQIVASQMGEKGLDLLGYSVLREGNILRLPTATLDVAQACSGLRSLLALTFLGQAYVCLLDGRKWMRPVMALFVIPVAVFANGARIIVSAIAASYRPEWIQGLFHESTGWIVFVVAFLCIVVLHSTFNHIQRKLRDQVEA
jgi:colanic acid biosynthesis glycosyl transferase WcaI